MTQVLDALALGSLPPFTCGSCRLSLNDRCEACAQGLDDAARVNEAIDAVQNAGTEAQALEAYASCLLGLAGAEVTR
jgi:hypothetical protein